MQESPGSALQGLTSPLPGRVGLGNQDWTDVENLKLSYHNGNIYIYMYIYST